MGIKKDIVSSDWLSKKTTSAAEKSAGQKNNISKDSISQTSQKSQEKLSDRDNLGNTLTEAQQSYFAESKVRDENGNLKVMYHGTTANFNIFKKGDVGYHFGTKGAARGRVGYSKNVTIKEVYLNITNPIVFDEDLGSWDADYRLTKELYARGILSKEEAEFILFTDNKLYKRSTESANKKLVEVLISKGYDGIEYQNTFETKKPTKSYIAFSSNQAKETTNTNPTSNPDIRYSDREFQYSYQTLISKPDMQITILNDNPLSNRAEIVKEGKKNVAHNGEQHNDGSVSVYVNDIDSDIIVTTESLRHGLDRRTTVIAPVVEKIGEILKNSIRINELLPREENTTKTQVLIGTAKDKNNNPCIVTFVVNTKNEVVEMDVLYSVNAKKRIGCA